MRTWPVAALALAFTACGLLDAFKSRDLSTVCGAAPVDDGQGTLTFADSLDCGIVNDVDFDAGTLTLHIRADADARELRDDDFIDTADLIGLWHLNSPGTTVLNTGDRVIDQSGGARHATAIDTNGVTTYTGGYLHEGIEFDGAAGRLEASDPAFDNLPRLSFTAWIKPDTYGEGGTDSVCKSSFPHLAAPRLAEIS